jgi:SAM-dependent methyltransferase
VEGVAAPVVVCTACGLGRFEPMPDAEARLAFYPAAYYGQLGAKFEPFFERLVRWLAARHAAFLTRGLPQGARVLDVGCGRGVLLGRLADRGYEAHGIELRREALEGIDPRAHVRVAPRLADAGYPDAHFDEVVFWHVLEHLDDPRGALVAAHRWVKPGGRLVVAVPNCASFQARWFGAAWFHLDPPRHLYHFPLPALERLVADVGFRIDSRHHFSLRQNPFGWIQSLENLSPRLPRNGLYALMYRRASGEPLPFDARTRFWLRLWFVLAAPFAVVASVLEALLRRGGTVHVLATRP